MNTYVQGRKIPMENSGRPSAQVLQLIAKLRWMGMEAEADQVQANLGDAAPTGSVITAPHETD
jgi:hypothetical protein